MQCARLYGAKIDGDEEVNWYEHHKSQHCWPSTTTKSSSAWRSSYKCKNNIESPLDLWTVSKRFRTSLEKGSKCNFNKKRDAGQGLYRFRNILRVGRFTPPPSTLLCQTKAPRNRIFFGIFTSFPLITKFTSDYYLKERERRKFLNEKEVVGYCLCILFPFSISFLFYDKTWTFIANPQNCQYSSAYCQSPQGLLTRVFTPLFARSLSSS